MNVVCLGGGIGQPVEAVAHLTVYPVGQRGHSSVT